MFRNMKKMDLNIGNMASGGDMKKSKAKVFQMDQNVKVRFKDVAGLQQPKLEI